AGLPDYRGRIRLRRRFGYPGRIDAYERVWLTFAGLDGTADVYLNDTPLGSRAGADGPFEVDVTDLLRQRNELCVGGLDLSGRGGLWGEVALEVRCTAFLRNVQAWWDKGVGRTVLHASGELVGGCAGPLELYGLANRATVLYAALTADGGVQSWHVMTEDIPTIALEATTLSMELIRVSVVWYALEVPVAPSGNP